MINQLNIEHFRGIEKLKLKDLKLKSYFEKNSFIIISWRDLQKKLIKKLKNNA